MKQRIGTGVRVAVCLGLVLAGACGMLAQPAANRSGDEAAIRKAGKDYVVALARGDAQALADFWTPHGTFTDRTGRTVPIAELLGKKGEEDGNSGSTPLPVKVRIRFVTDDVAIEDGEFVTAGSDDAPPAEGRYTALWVREAGRWKLDNVRELPGDAEDDQKQLAAMDIFVGKWAGEDNGIALEISAHWDTNKKFLTRRITMTSGNATLAGTQFIGWDPRSQQIRSWMFSDDGSYTDGVWEMEGNAWMALTSRVLPDGRVSEATQVYQFPGKDTMVWKVLNGSIDGTPTDDCEVTLKKSVAK